ncbi:MAG: YhcH/YjgK/YiaL family protein [Verrucomicrobiota bacterium]
MLYGKLDDLENYAALIAHPIWRRAFTWIQEMPAQPECKIHELDGERLFVNVMRYETVPVEEARFESHRRYIDLQYTIEGGEQIELAHSDSLQPDGAYDAERDLQFYLPAPATSRVDKQAGWFSIYFPQDAHRPKLADGRHDAIYKLVVKIDLGLL